MNIKTTINRLSHLFNASKKENLIANVSYLMILKVVSVIVPLILLPFLIPRIGMNKYGAIFLGMSLINYFSTLTDYGFNVSAPRDVAKSKHNAQSLAFIYSKVITVRALVLLASLFIIFFIVQVVPIFRTERVIIYILASSLIGRVLFPDWFFQGVEAMKYITFIDILAKILLVIGVLSMIRRPSDYYIYPLLIAITSLITGIIGHAILFFKYKIRFYLIGPHRIWQIFVENGGLFINQFLPQLYNNSTSIVLSFFVNAAMVGMYGAAKSVVEIGVMVITIFSTAFYPYLSRAGGHFSLFSRYIIAIAVGLFFLFSISSGYIISFLHLDARSARLLIIVLALGIPFSTIYLCYGVNFFIARNISKVVIRNTIAASIIGFVASFPLIIYFGVIGAAINLTFSRALMGVGLAIKYRTFLRRENLRLFRIA